MPGHRVKKNTDVGFAGRSLILSTGNNRTMRMCMDGCLQLLSTDLSSTTPIQAAFVLLSAYALYVDGLTEAMVSPATEVRQCIESGQQNLAFYKLPVVLPDSEDKPTSLLVDCYK
jgi:hypothetical protein